MVKDFNIQNPQYLTLLLLPLGILLGFAIITGKEKKTLFLLLGEGSKFIKQYAFRKILLEGAFSLALFSIALGTLGITWGRTAVEEDRAGLDIIFALDISRSMLVQDVSPSRLEYAKQIAQSVVTHSSDARFGIVIFKGTALRVIPLTKDRITVERFLKEVEPSFLGSKGTNLAEALQISKNSFSKTEKRRGVLILLSDGETQDSVPSSLLTSFKNEGIPVFTIGIGTPEGGGIFAPEQVRDKQGRPVISRLQREVLQYLARETGGRYYETEEGWIDRLLLEDLEGYRKKMESIRIRWIPADRSSWFLGMGLLFICLFVFLRSVPWVKEG
ncbi:MAG: VWA domain-containing protein [Spirochaetales bacterium]